MISVVYCTRESNSKHSEHLMKMFGHPKVEILEYVNKGEGLTKFYQKGLDESKYDIVVFLHDDILIETKQAAKKIVKLFDRNPEYGILGVAGTKYLSDTGRWWEDRKSMYGKVYHTHEGKTWLSSYSEDLGNRVEEVVTVDGVFFSVHKKRIKTGFNEEVKGFHFYDIDFCFNNYLFGVKVGVHTNIKINHMSIGQTNDEWEQNRQAFADKFKENLPVKIKKVFGPHNKMKVLIGCLSFANLTGSEMYVYELVKGLVKNNCDVTICSRLGQPMVNKAKKLGIKLYDLSEPPGYKLGDGQWGINTPQGLVPSEEGKLYKVSETDFDILHLNHKPITEHFLQLYPATEAICTIHSEVIDLEKPVINNSIKKYIAIRPEIKEFLINDYGIDESKIDVIYNPIDSDRFKLSNVKKTWQNKRILFVGTIDYLRRNTILDLIRTTADSNDELWLVGKENDVKVSDILNQYGSDTSHVKYFGPQNNVENYIKQCDETAGILLGRTTIEGWMCGKKGWIYDIDSSGNILGKNLHDIPDDIDKFKSDTVSQEIINEYYKILT